MLEKDIKPVKPFIDLRNPLIAESDFAKVIARVYFMTKSKGQVVVPEKEWSEKKAFYKSKLIKTQNELKEITTKEKAYNKEMKELQAKIQSLTPEDNSEELFKRLNELSDKKTMNETMKVIYTKDSEFTQFRYNKLVSKDKYMKEALSNSKIMANLILNVSSNTNTIELFKKDLAKLEAHADEDKIELWQAVFKYIGRSEEYEELAMNNEVITKTSNDVLHIYYNYLIEIKGMKEEDITEDMLTPPVIDWTKEETIDEYCNYWQNIYNKLEEYYKSAIELKGTDKQILAEILKFLYMCMLSKGSLIHAYNQSKEKMYLDYKAFDFHYHKLIEPVASELLKGNNTLEAKYLPILFAYILLLLNKSNNIIGVIELM